MLNKKALAASVSAPPSPFVEDVFSTYLYTGNGTSQTITNNVDISGKGGLVWVKRRSGAALDHCLSNTSSGAGKHLISNATDAQATDSSRISSFTSSGFTVGGDSTVNNNADTYCSWTFREQAKFFDVVTYTGNGSSQNISHNLGSVPGMIIVKRTNSGGTNWNVYHRSLGASEFLKLNSTDAQANNTTIWNNTAPTSTVFSVGALGAVNGNGDTYVAYLFAHDAGGFGTAGTDNVISCGSATVSASSSVTVNLGYEPQYVLVKGTSFVSSWWVADNMREMSNTATALLRPNVSGAELNGTQYITPTATGFVIDSGLYGIDGTVIYMAIRRPMKVPTTGTSVFLPSVYVGSASVDQIINTGFTVDMTLARIRNAAVSMEDFDRLRGNTKRLETNSTGAEATVGLALKYDLSNSVNFQAGGNLNLSASYNQLAYNFCRASGFMDVVCYTGTGSATTQAHNLTVVPELMIFKDRSGTNGWVVYASALTATSGMVLNNANAAFAASSLFNNTEPTATQFTVNTAGNVNSSGANYVAYLFATCAGVSKVGSYTGTGTTLAINCGFTGGARFVLIKRTDSTGDWYVWDTARGIISGNDPYLLLNSSAAEVTSTDYIDPVSSGFELSSTAPAAINASGGSFIFFAIA